MMRDDLREIRIANIKVKDNVRRGELKVDDLVESIRDRGLLQPILVRRTGEGYELVAGHRRLAACRALRMERIPAVIRDGFEADRVVTQLAENVQRDNLTPYDVSLALRRLRAKGGDITEIATAVRKSYPWVSQHLDYGYIYEGLIRAGVEKALLDRVPWGTLIELKHVQLADQVALINQIVPDDPEQPCVAHDKARELIEARRYVKRVARPAPATFPVSVDELTITVECDTKLQQRKIVQLLLQHGGTRA